MRILFQGAAETSDAVIAEPRQEHGNSLRLKAGQKNFHDVVAVAGLRRSRTDKLKYKHLLETQDIIPLFLASPDKMVWINGISQNNIGKNSAVHPLSLIVIGNGMADFFKDINKRNVSGYGKNRKIMLVGIRKYVVGYGLYIMFPY